MISIRRTSLAIASLALAASGAAFAQHSDIEVEVIGGQLVYEQPEPGLNVFEAEFPLPDGMIVFPYQTDDPGFEIDLNPANIGGFNVLGSLYYWDGASSGFVKAGMNDAITISSRLDGGTTTVDGMSVVQRSNITIGSLDQTIGQADGDGELHDHVDFAINSDAPLGAYGIFMSLSATGVADSAPFGILFNLGLAENVYETGVDVFNSLVVPLPAAGWLLLSGIGMLLVGRRRNTAATA